MACSGGERRKLWIDSCRGAYLGRLTASCRGYSVSGESTRRYGLFADNGLVPAEGHTWGGWRGHPAEGSTWGVHSVAESWPWVMTPLLYLSYGVSCVAHWHENVN